MLKCECHSCMVALLPKRLKPKIESLINVAIEMVMKAAQDSVLQLLSMKCLFSLSSHDCSRREACQRDRERGRQESKYKKRIDRLSKPHDLTLSTAYTC